MKEQVKVWLMVLTMVILYGCHDQEQAESTMESVRVSLAFSVPAAAPAQAGTRMGDAVTQANANYRGITIQKMIPFRSTGKVGAGDQPLRMFDEATQTEHKEKDNPYGAFYEFNTYTMMTGTSTFLAYGKAVNANMPKTENGSLVAAFDNDYTVGDISLSCSPADIRISPDRIRATTDIPADAQALADALTTIAQAKTSDGKLWSNSHDTGLEALYENFTGLNADGGYSLLAGSTANVTKHIEALEQVLTGMTYADGSDEAGIRQAILTAIGAANLPADYPATIALPDGAAVLMWNKETGKFEPQTQTTTKAAVNTITRYCYPAELYYYTNSPIRTSTKDMSQYYTNETDWKALLANFENTNGTVRSDTRSVAIEKPLQYGVARLKATMKAGYSKLKDRYDNEVDLSATPKAFPLTAVIVCNQHTQGFDFTPTDETGDDCFIYDTQVNKADDNPYYLTTTEQDIPSTLVLQTKDGEEVAVIMEFRNDSGQDIYGHDGIIYQGTKFYLVGKLKPAEGTGDSVSDDDVKRRVFTQDHITTVTMTVDETESLPNAYNVLPDILSGRLELGIELTPQWIQATTTTIILE